MTQPTKQRQPTEEHGFTLIELLITIVLMGILTVSLGNALLSYLQNTDTTTRRLGESHDAQISAAYFAQDVDSIGVRTSTTPFTLVQSVALGPALTPLPCAPAGTSTSIVRFSWDDPSSATTVTGVTVAYVVMTVAGESQLHRLVCLGSSSTPIVDVVLVHNLNGSPTVTCGVVVGTVGTCSGGTGTAVVPQWVTMVLSVKNPKDTGSALAVTLMGQRRQTS